MTQQFAQRLSIVSPMATKHDRASRAVRGASNAAPGRADAPASCGVAGECGGCSHVQEPYVDQLAAKDARMRDLFSAAFPSADLRPIIGMDDPFHYRNKVTSPFAPGKRGPHGGRAILTGMYAPGSHRIVETRACLVESEQGQQVIAAVKAIMLKHGIAPYDEDRGTGFLRHAVVRVGHESGEVLVTLVTNGEAFPSSKQFCRELVKRCPFVTTVVQNVNTRQTNVILGDREQRLYGPGFILDTLCGLSFRISSHSFYQVNAVQTEVLYRAALKWALDGIDLEDIGRPLSIMDAYCGTGTIGLVAASMAGDARVIGVDKVASAIRDARQNAAHNGIENATFITADAGDYLRLRASAGERFDVLIMDPPRAGSSEEFLRAAAESGVDRIVYISCNPHTQVRDVRYLRQFGYKLCRIQPVDMFPHTDHVETIALLSRKGPVSSLQNG